MKILLAVALITFVSLALGSSHSEAPGTASRPNADITDLYVFRSYESGRDTYVTFLMNTYPLQSPYGGPNYYSLSDEHFYEIYIDRNSDGNEDYTFQWIYGNSLPSATATGLPYIYGEDKVCNPLYNASDVPSQPASPISQGIALNIGGNQVRIALKVAGFITNSLVPTSSRAALNWEEYYFLNLLTGNLSNPTIFNLTSSGNRRFDKPFDYAGQNSFGSPSDYDTYAMSFINTVTLNNMMACPASASGKVWVGQREDPFYISLGRIFDYLNMIPVGLPQFSTLTIAECLTNNDLREKNVATFALEIPITCVNAMGSIINVWAGTRRLYHADNDLLGQNSHIPGPQVSRMGNPLVNELVIGLIDKNRFSRQHPRLDTNANYGFGTFVFYPTLPEIINIRYRDAVNGVLGSSFATLSPSTPRNDLAAVFLTGITGVNKGPGGFVGEVIRLNLGSPAVARENQNHYGVIGAVIAGNDTDYSGFPNGRRPGDDVVDIALMAMIGVLCSSPFTGLALCAPNATAPIGFVPLTDGSPVRATYYQNKFPYFNIPTPGSYLDGFGSNVVQNASVCYPPSQHGRCPVSAQCGGSSSSSAPAQSSSVTSPSAMASPSASPTCPQCTCSSASTVGGFVLSILSMF